MAVFLGALLGATILTFLLSRLFLWLARKSLKGQVAIIVAHLVSIALIFVVAGFGAANGGPFKADAVLIYLIPQAAWLVFDLTRYSIRESNKATTDA